MSNKLIVKVVHGSRLYGLAGPDSDLDVKGIHLPDSNDCLLMNACRNTREQTNIEDGFNWSSFSGENGKDIKIEHESFALQEFLKLACRGESIVLDMLHSSHNHILEMSEDRLWLHLRSMRKKFYTKKMVGAVGYSKTMALKYGFRADRMNALGTVLTFLKQAQQKGVSRLYQCWDDFPSGQHIERGTEDRNNNSDKRFIEIAGKKLQATITVEYAIEVIEKSYNRYGDRVAEAAKLEGNDLKAICHSFRVAYQLLHMYKDGDFSFPLPETEFLRDVKFGKIGFMQDGLDKKLNDLVSEVEELALKSEYPAKVDSEFVTNTILDAYFL